MKNLAVKLLINLLKIHSPPYKEEKAIRTLHNYVSELNYDEVYIDDVGNLIASYGQGPRIISLIGHIDTIPDFIPVHFDGNIITGRGAVDAKGPLTAMFIGASLAKRFIDLNRVKVYVIATVGEEGSSHGAWYLIKRGFKSDYVVIGEPSNGNGIVIGYRGSCKIVIKCSSKGGHSSTPWISESACDKLINIWLKLKDMFNGASSKEFSISLLKLSCGSNYTVLPKEGSAYIDIRIPIGSGIDEVLNNIRNGNMDFERCSFEVKDFVKPVTTPINAKIVRALVRSIIRANLKPKLLIKLGTSDMNLLHGTVSNEVVAYGPGKSELAHTDQEYIEVNELMTGINIYKNVIIEILNLLY